MAVAFVAERAKSGGSGTAVSVGSLSSVTVGNHIIAVIHVAPPASGTSSVSSVTDTEGNPWQIDTSTAAVGFGGHHGIALCSTKIVTLTAGQITSLTVHLSTSTTIGYKFEEFSGLDLADWLDTAASGVVNVSSLSMTAGPISPANSGETLVAGYGPNLAEASASPSSSFTQAGTPRNVTAEVICMYAINANAGLGGGTCAVPTSTAYAQAVGAYLPSAVKQPLEPTVMLQAVNRAATY